MKITFASKIYALVNFERLAFKGTILPKELEGTIFEGIYFMIWTTNNLKKIREEYFSKKIERKDILEIHGKFMGALGGLRIGWERVINNLKKA